VSVDETGRRTRDARDVVDLTSTRRIHCNENVASGVATPRTKETSIGPK